MALHAQKTFRKGEILLQEGERGDCAYIIEEGSVEIIVNRAGTQVRLGTRGPGSIIGEMAMIDDKPRTATIRALEDCHVLEISRDDFTRRVEDADPVVRMVMQVVSARYRDMIARTDVVRIADSNGAVEVDEHSGSAHMQALDALKLHQELKIALAQDQLRLFYQPIIDLHDMKIAGFEALMRWMHPDKGMISPGIFIPIAEESGLIVEMSQWALRTACLDVQKLQADISPALAAKNGPLFISVNFSVRDFSDPDFYTNIEKTLKNTEAEAAQIHLEITETLLMKAPEQAKTALEKCRDGGLKISIDDFGSGYSSLSYLHYFPIDTLKVDQSFVRSMSTHPASLVLVKSILTLARSLGMKVIAEGIETRAEAATLRTLGCGEGQGFWFAKPMPLDKALEFTQKWAPPEF